MAGGGDSSLPAILTSRVRPASASVAEEGGARLIPRDALTSDPTMDDLDRLFLRLVQNLRAGYPEYLTHPFEVAELYQSVVPYRHNRRELAIDTNGDYETALLRLLSGERGYLQGD